MDQVDILRHAINVLETLEVPYMIVGSFASSAYGEPRFTQDIDVVIDLRPDLISNFCAAFPPPAYYLSEVAVRQAVASRFQFNVLHTMTGNKIDFLLSRSDAWGKLQLSRRQRIPLLSDREGFVARPEDVILGKLLYYAEGGSEKHLRDITGILQVSAMNVDRDYVTYWANQLGILKVWQAVLNRCAPE